MRRRVTVFTVIVVIIFTSCSPRGKDQTHLIQKDSTSKNEMNNTLFVFIGEQLDFAELPYDTGSMDNGFKAKYKILQRIYGYYASDTIEFVTYDHYGIPAFSKYKNAMLFVSEYEGKCYQEKYQFFDVYKTKNNRWASSYKDQDYGHPYNEQTTVKPEIIPFAEPLHYPRIIRYNNNETDTAVFLEPYYKVVGDSAYAVYGNYVEELFRLKKEGILAARGLFSDRDGNETPTTIEDVKLEEVPTVYNKEDLKFIAFWKSLANTISKSNVSKFKKAMLDSLWVGDTVLTTNIFFSKCYHEVFDEKLISKFKDTAAINYSWGEADPSIVSFAPKLKIKKNGKIYKLREVEITKVADEANPEKITLDFIETNKGYKLFSCEYSGNKKCCQ